MSPRHTRLRSRLGAAVVAGALTAGTLTFASSPAQAAPVTTTGSGPTAVSDATFTWGLSGYAQAGIFGPWTFKDLTGDATLLTGSVSGGTQTEYATAPQPATSMPVSTPQKTPNAVKFTEGVGTIDEETGAGDLAWDGSYTVNAYPAQYNAPNEVYSDPQLSVEADGSGVLTAEFTIGAGVAMDGTPFEATEFGRLELATFDAGSLTATSDTGFRVTPDYQGVDNGLAGQDKTCTTAGGATGWWGSWPQDLIDALGSSPAGQSVLPHFYSTGCGGAQDKKPPLPFDVTFHAADAPSVTVSETAIDADGTATVTVTGDNFDPALATGSRPPLAGQPAGTYIVFGKFADAWRPSQGATSTSRKVLPSAQKWAVPAASLPTIGGTAGGGVELTADGGFTTELTVDKAALDAIATDPSLVDYGIYTYPGSGGVAPAYETYTPLTFATPKDDTTVVVTGLPSSSPYGAARAATVTVDGPGDAVPTGTVTAMLGTTKVGAGTLNAAGVATFPVSRLISVGTREITFSYAGNDAFNASTAARSLKVVLAKVNVTRSSTTKPTTKRAGRTTVTVRSLTGGPYVNGKFTIWFKKPGRTTRSTTRTLYSGKSVVTIPKLSKGTWKVCVKYLGTSRYARTATTYEGSFKVTR